MALSTGFRRPVYQFRIIATIMGWVLEGRVITRGYHVYLDYRKPLVPSIDYRC